MSSRRPDARWPRDRGPAQEKGPLGADRDDLDDRRDGARAEDAQLARARQDQLVSRRPVDRVRRLRRRGHRERGCLSADTGGARETVLVKHPANDMDPVWVPDGSAIVFISDRTGALGAWLLRVAEGRAQSEPEMLRRIWDAAIFRLALRTAPTSTPFRPAAPTSRSCRSIRKRAALPRAGRRERTLRPHQQCTGVVA